MIKVILNDLNVNHIGSHIVVKTKRSEIAHVNHDTVSMHVARLPEQTSGIV